MMDDMDGGYYQGQDEEEDAWEEDMGSVDIDMERAFQTQIMGMMQLAGLMMGGMNPSMMGEDDFPAEFGYEQPRRRDYDDFAPIPHNPPPSNTAPEPSFTAPHTFLLDKEIMDRGHTQSRAGGQKQSSTDDD